MVDAVQAGRGVVDYPGIYPIANNTVLANISGVPALPVEVSLSALAAAIGTPVYQGVWNANTNTPALVSSVGVNGNYYVVSVAGATNLNGITDWSVGDWAIFNSTANAWQKIEGGATTLSVGSTLVSNGNNTRILYNNAGVLGEYTLTGTGTVVAMSIGPTITSSAQATPAATFTNSASTDGTQTIQLFAPNLSANNNVAMILGKSTTSKEAVAFNFNWVSAGSTSNGLKVYLNGLSNPMLYMQGTGTFGFGLDAAACTLQLGGATASFPAFIRSATTIKARLADNSADAPFTAAAGTFTGLVTTTGAGRVIGNRTISASATVLATDDLISLTGGAAQTLTMLAASTNSGKRIFVMNRSGNSWTIDATALGQIVGNGVALANTFTLVNNTGFELLSDGTVWELL